ncbi:MAG TPA: HAMP domain-containing sensor histidine kinase [Chthoniobacteraceae bacterium]|nr:HAMP domain-containing sensor histidine kinase [Chthoniobacteraceae bacterium]
MKQVPFRTFRRMGQDVRTWPMLVLLLLIVLVAIGCVLWFMREAMRNERMAVRQKLADAYRSQLSFVQQRVEQHWMDSLKALDESLPGAVLFVRTIREGKADSVIYFGADGRVAYPQPPLVADSGGDAIEKELRSMVLAGKKDEAVRFVLEKFAGGQFADVANGQGRLVAGNAELIALELIGSPSEERFGQIADRLRERLSDYDRTTMPSAQRRFLMQEMRRLSPETTFPTLNAEDIAARYLDAYTSPIAPEALSESQVPGIWHAASPQGRVIALHELPSLRKRLTEATNESSFPIGVGIAVIPPGEDAVTESKIVTSSLDSRLPGWRLSLQLNDRAIFDAEAERRVTNYLWMGAGVVSAMMLLAFFIARNFGRQMKIARLKNDLTATVSHELKTPLTSMRALVETLLDTERFDEQTTREYLQLLARENARLSRLIDNFLTFSRLERNKFTFQFAPHNPGQIAAEAQQAMDERGHAPKSLCESYCDANLPTVMADSDALVTALLNLLENAWKYSGEEKRIILRTQARNGNVSFSVEDNGIGLSPRDIPRVFSRFYQVDQRLSRSTSGCGLGLSIVKSIAEAHGGSISVTSEVGRGSTFTIEIPAARIV